MAKPPAAILTASVRQELADEWAAVRKLTAATRARSVVGIYFVSYAPPKGFLNLPLVLAIGMLERFLAELLWRSPTFPKLEAMMETSKGLLNWKDFDLVDEGRNARNGIAHHAVLVSDPLCVKYIDAIEIELVAWGVVKT